MIKAIVFDLGGVVFHGDFNNQVDYLSKKYNITPESYLKVFREAWDKTKVGELTQEEFYDYISNALKISPEDIRKSLLKIITIDEKMRDLIIALSQNYKIGILTNTIEDLYNKQLELWDFEENADVIASFKEHVAKPDEKAMELILQKLGVEKNEIIFIDDKKETVKRYSELGITSIKFTGYEQLLKKLKAMEIEI